MDRIERLVGAQRARQRATVESAAGEVAVQERTAAAAFRFHRMATTGVGEGVPPRRIALGEALDRRLGEQRRERNRDPHARSTASIIRAASSEWPPRSKKLSCTPTLADAEQVLPDVRELTSSDAAAAGRASRARCASRASGSGSAARSSLPLAVSGSAASTTSAAGTMYVGQRAAQVAPQVRRLRRMPSAARHDVGDQIAASPPSSPRTTPTASRTLRQPQQRRLDLAGLDPVAREA